MSSKIPLLISRNFVVFPNAAISLEVGRDRSIAAIENAINNFKSQLIIVSQVKYDIDHPVHSDIYKVGTLATVKILQKNKDNSLIVELTGLKRVSLLNVRLDAIKKESIANKSWFCEYETLKEKNDTYAKNKEKIKHLISHFENVIDVDANEFKAIVELSKAEKPDCKLIVDKLSNLWPQNEAESPTLRQSWLEELDVAKRIDSILAADFITDSLKEDIDNTITRKVNRNISKQQKEFYLRERIKVMKEELGESAAKEADIQKVKKWIKTSAAPKKVKDKVQEELNKLEISPSMSSETMVIRSYIDWVISLPWSTFSTDEKNLTKIKKTLDENHQGLTKIKTRITEYIAVQKKTKKPMGSIICLVGPPGVGKTSLAQSIATALNKKYVKIALGGVNDEAEIRGHRKTYVASMPGKIVKALKQAGVNNPLILLDEIDKLNVSYHGDPVSALLEVLDPKQNSHFCDHYIEEEIDLSNVMFIATANYEENIPDPLLDRLEMINLTSYTETEKLSIAKHNLIPEVLKEHALKDTEIIFQDDALLYMIQRYTREAGVRSLKRCLSKIARKFISEQETDKIENIVVDIEAVKKYLSKELYDFTIKDEVPIPGIVNGMAYTEFGGDLLPIEINYYPGKGNIMLTGNLKETMKESANVALSYIRANESNFKLNNVNWCDLDINLHVPSGGIPKDGPSAGITITTALISAFLKVPVPSNVAMTGEITLRGKVLPIGGLKEKIISAVRGGIEVIFYPKQCEKYLDDIPKEILDKIKLYPIVNYSEIYEKLFT